MRSLLFLVVGTLIACTPKSTPQHLLLESGVDGWMMYTNAERYKAKNCASIQPVLGDPDAAVVLYLASFACKDQRYQQAMVDQGAWETGTARSLDKWRSWKVISFEVLGVKEPKDGVAWVRTYVEIEIRGELETGTDEFELVKDGDVWKILKPMS